MKRRWNQVLPFLFPFALAALALFNGPLSTWSVQTVEPNQAHESVDQKRAVFVDVREPDETQGGYLPGAILMPLSILKENLERLPKDKVLLTYCRSGARAKKASLILEKAGFKTQSAGGYSRLKPNNAQGH